MDPCQPALGRLLPHTRHLPQDSGCSVTMATHGVHTQEEIKLFINLPDKFNVNKLIPPFTVLYSLYFVGAAANLFYIIVCCWLSVFHL